jgi:hypothetical protein
VRGGKGRREGNHCIMCEMHIGVIVLCAVQCAVCSVPCIVLCVLCVLCDIQCVLCSALRYIPLTH